MQCQYPELLFCNDKVSIIKCFSHLGTRNVNLILLRRNLGPQFEGNLLALCGHAKVYERHAKCWAPEKIPFAKLYAKFIV